MERSQFTFYRSFWEAISELKKNERQIILEAIIKYALYGEKPKIDGTSKAMFTLIAPTLDASARKAKSGSAGGSRRSKTEAEREQNGSKEAEANEKQNASKTEANEKQNAREKENDIEKEKELEIENECYIISSEPKIVSAPPVITLPLNDGTEYPVTVEQTEKWAGLYPAVDVIQQLRAMKGWLIANPTKRKTKTGIPRFINTWLAKEQDRGRPATAQKSAQSGNIFADLARRDDW